MIDIGIGFTNVLDTSYLNVISLPSYLLDGQDTICAYLLVILGRSEGTMQQFCL
jgi:hypothetical protein